MKKTFTAHLRNCRVIFKHEHQIFRAIHFFPPASFIFFLATNAANSFARFSLSFFASSRRVFFFSSAACLFMAARAMSSSNGILFFAGLPFGLSAVLPERILYADYIKLYITILLIINSLFSLIFAPDTSALDVPAFPEGLPS